MLGLINVLKPSGLTSSDVVVRIRSKLRKALQDKKIKVGHLGTLDPMACGVLPIVFGKATRLFDYYVKSDKKYRACFVFGKTTDTLDSDGKVIQNDGITPDICAINDILPQFVGDIMQLPPSYSRISVGGVRACDAERRGQSIELEPRPVTIFDIQILSYDNNELWLDIHCSGGTYIRSLCRDIAECVGCVAYMPCLIRLDNKGMAIENAIPIDDINETNVIELSQKIDNIIEYLPKYELNESDSKRILNGLAVNALNRGGDYLLYIDNKLYGICCDDDETIKTLIRLWE